MKTNLPTVLLAIFSLPVWAGPTLEVRNSEGRALVIELIALEEDNVVFSTATSKGKEHSLAITKFEAGSQEKIREEAKSLPPRLPKLNIEVVVRKSREKRGYFMIDQEVSTKVKLRNLSTRLTFPAAKAEMTYFGRNRKNPDNYKVMSKRPFEVDTLIPNKASEKDVLGFKTSFDSDNKGYGNIGGYEYDCYLLTISDAAGNILIHKTSDAGVRAAIEKDSSKAKQLSELKEGVIVDKNLEVQE